MLRSRGGMKESNNLFIRRRKAADRLERPKEKRRSPRVVLFKLSP